MIALSSTSIEDRENPVDENDQSVTSTSSKTVDFSSKELPSFSTVTKAGGLSSVTKSARKPLLELSKGQLNSRQRTTSVKSINLEKSAKRLARIEKVVRIDTPAFDEKKPLLRNISSQISISSLIRYMCRN